MKLGEKLKKARQDKGLSQSQVCGDFITRNMLSQLEHDLASPSLKTLEYLSKKLDVSISWLVDDAAPYKEDDHLKRARNFYCQKNYEACYALLEKEPSLSQEAMLLALRSALALSAHAFQQGSVSQARSFATRAISLTSSCMYADSSEQLSAQFLLANCQIASHANGCDCCKDFLLQSSRLPYEDERHLISAYLAIQASQLSEAEHELALITEHGASDSGLFSVLKGCLMVEKGEYADALLFLQQIELQKEFPKSLQMELFRLLELCYKELEDFRMAYHYACLRLKEQ